RAERQSRSLDAGCGTGLCGPLLKPFATRLVGVDLSPGMLAEAAKRELYDELVEAELGAYLTAHRSSFNIIVGCDTLVYIGQLEDTIAAAATALKPDGLLLFTLEHLAEGGEDRRYRLAPTGRFSHPAAYVRATLANAGLVDVITDPIIPRLECGEPVHGPASRAHSKLIGRYGALLPLFRLVGVPCIAAFGRVKSLLCHHSDRPKLANRSAGYFAGATSLTGVPSALVFSPGLLAAFRSRSISPARRS